MSNIKLVITDVDGTLVQPQEHELSQAVRDAVVAAENASVQIVPVTGRPYEMAQPVMQTLGFDGLCVVDNGASIHEVISGKLVWSCWLDAETVRKLVALILPYSTAIDYAVTWEEHVPDPATEMDLVHDAAPYVWSFVPTKDADEIEAQLGHIADLAWSRDLHTTDPNLTAFQITNREATKFHGVQALRELNGIALEHTMAIGDGPNDLPLFENAGLKIAMGNAVDLLKVKADHIVASVTDDGFAEAIHAFVLS